MTDNKTNDNNTSDNLLSIQTRHEQAVLLEFEENKRDPHVDRKLCSYGDKCYRKNPNHFAEFRHLHLEKTVSKFKPIESIDSVLQFLQTLPSPSQKHLGVLIGSRAAAIACSTRGIEWHRPITDDTNFDILIGSVQLIEFLVSKESEIKKVLLDCTSPILQTYKLFCTTQDNKSYDFEVATNNNCKVLELCNDSYGFSVQTIELCSGVSVHVASLELLHAFKQAHVCFNLQWWKTIEDLHFFRQHVSEFLLHGTQVVEIYEQRAKEMEIRLGGGENNQKSYEDMFQICDTSIYNKVAFTENQPVFLQYQTTTTVLFEKAPLSDQLKMVFEAAMVIALKFYLIPANIEVTNIFSMAPVHFWQKAYSLAIQRICTNSSKGYMRDFVINNYPQLKWLQKDLASVYQKHFYCTNRPHKFVAFSSWMTKSNDMFLYFYSKERAELEAPSQYKDFLGDYYNAVECEDDSSSSSSSILLSDQQDYDSDDVFSDDYDEY